LPRVAGIGAANHRRQDVHRTAEPRVVSIQGPLGDRIHQELRDSTGERAPGVAAIRADHIRPDGVDGCGFQGVHGHLRHATGEGIDERPIGWGSKLLTYPVV
jgi:hypothetical protein